MKIGKVILYIFAILAGIIAFFIQCNFEDLVNYGYRGFLQ